MAGTVCRKRLYNLFRDLVDIYSPSNREEEITAFLSAFLEEHGLPVSYQQVDDTRSNLIVCSGDHPQRLFLGHLDTVPAYDIEQYSFNEHDGLCCGLGTADMKSGCAAMVEAFICAAENATLPPQTALALVVGEEEAGDGTQVLLQAHRFQTALVAEPTDLRPCLEHYGYVELLVRAFGYRRHAAMSNRDTNAIRAMLRLLIQLEDRIENEEPSTVLNIRDLHSSESGFAVPDRCAAAIDLHLPPGISARRYAEQLRRFVSDALESSRASRHEIDFPTLADGFQIAADEPLPRALKEIFQTLERPWNPMAFHSHSDANLLCEAGCSPLILGPGQLSKAHTRDESVAFEQVVAAAEIYARLLDRADGSSH